MQENFYPATFFKVCFRKTHSLVSIGTVSVRSCALLSSKVARAAKDLKSEFAVSMVATPIRWSFVMKSVLITSVARRIESQSLSWRLPKLHCAKKLHRFQMLVANEEHNKILLC